jgi:nicotinamidase-related amidase
MQNDFMEGGNLAVPGSRKDIEHLTHFIYNNLDKISQIMCSLDIHSIAQIFHPYWWKDENGNHPKPYTVIPYDDVQQGKWKPVCGETARSLEYLKNIEKNGKRQLCIWPYHCLAGSFGASLEFEFTKMLYFHSVSRNSKPLFIQKGTDPYSEMYGIIKAEYDPTNFINIQVLNAIEKSDEIYIAGEAASHCLMDSAEQIFEYFAERPDITQKITILEDCTSPIAGFEQATIDTFEFFKTQYGVKIAKSTEIQL